jgi:hypothetical protein
VTHRVGEPPRATSIPGDASAPVVPKWGVQGRTIPPARRADLEALLLAEVKRLDDPYRLWNQPR